MNIIIDCFKLVKGAGKSIGIYNLSVNLVKNLADFQITSNNEKIRNNRIVVLGNKYNSVDFSIDGVQFYEIKYNPINKFFCIYWELFYVEKYYRILKGDRIIFPRGYAPFSKKVNDLIIIHDMIPFYYDSHFPGYFNRVENFYIMSRLKSSIKKCKKVITISEASKAEILNIVHIKDNKIAVINNGLNRIEIDEDGALKLTGNNSYIFAMASSLPHKNANGIFEAYEKYYEICQKPLKLVVVGVEKVQNIKPEILNNIICIKYLDNNKILYGLMRNAEIFLFLSLAEGFGFPPIEAMCLGVPVICSNLSSLPEVVADSALLVDPVDSKMVARGLIELQNNNERQKELIRKGFENIKRFDWNRLAGKYWKEICNM